MPTGLWYNLLMKWRDIILRSGATLIFLLLVSAYFDIKLHITWIPEVIVAWGTLVLAYATYQLGRTTKEEGALQREENRRLIEEERERQAQSGVVGQAHVWVTELQEFITLRASTDTPEELMATREGLIGLSFKGLGMPTQAKVFGDELTPFVADVNQAIDKFAEFLKTLTRQLFGLSDTEEMLMFLKNPSTVEVVGKERFKVAQTCVALSNTITRIKRKYTL